VIYLDNAATTKIYPEVLEAMMPYLTEEYGNAGTIYGLGRNAADAVMNARQQVADFIGAMPEQIIFTSGGSEANNTALKGAAPYLKAIGKKHVVVSAVEHDSVLKAAKSLEKAEGDFCIHTLGVNGNCVVKTQELQKIIDNKEVGFVSVMYVNNETGAVNPVREIGKMCGERGILFHTDCVQAAGCQEINVDDIQCDFLSLSSHKIHGAKGAGALYVRDNSVLTPLICGGGEQEYGLRGGTENVAGIVGFGKACELQKKYAKENLEAISSLRSLFYSQLTKELRKSGMDNMMSVNGAYPGGSAKVLNLCFEGIDGETLLLMLDASGVCVSAGSACRSHESEPSHVLLAMGVTPEKARSSVRVSFSAMNTVEEVIQSAEIIARCVSALCR
jgi:cysteine desulfurase